MFLSSLLIVTAITIISNGIFLSFFINKQTDFSLQELSYIQKQLSFFIASTDNYSRTIISDPLIQGFALNYKNNQNGSDLKSVRTIKEEINHIIQNTKYIHSVSLYDTQQNLLVSTDPKATPISSEEFEALDVMKWLPTTKQDAYRPLLPIYTFSSIRPFYSYDTGEALGYIEMALLESEIRAIFDHPVLHTSSISIVDASGTIQSTNSDYPIRSPYPNAHLLEPTKNAHYTFGDGHITFYEPLPELNAYITSQIPIRLLISPLYTLVLVCFAISLLCMIFYLPLAHRIAGTITLPIMEMIRHTKTIKKGVWQPIQVTQTDTDITLLVDAFNSMILAQEQLKNELLHTQKTKDQLTLDLLQEQINPHFLYNTLDNICSLAEIGEIALLNQLIYNLSNFYRKGLSSGKSYITIQEELDMIRSYIQILQIRYYDQFDFVIDCPPHLLDYPCLKFLLQPIVENSIYHGIKPLDDKGLIHISVTEQSDTLTLTVLDNGIGISSQMLQELWEDESSHFGIRNIHNRIQLHYGKDYGLQIQNSLTAGCEVSITLNKKGGS
ncbi:MAG: sensor histidine kinase [Cellulosilyticaceae bacterium]